MILSDEQMQAVNHGRETDDTWSLIDLPEGPQPLPEWARGLHVDFMDGYGNWPHYTILGAENLRRWPDKRYEKINSMFIARHEDGRAEIYHHAGPIQPAQIRMWKGQDGIIRQHFTVDQKPGEWVEVEKLATTQQEGFGGSHYHITLLDGREVVLRGPWHGGAPAGYVDVAYADRSAPDFARQSAWWRKSNLKHGLQHRHSWGTCTAGLFITEDLLIRLFARFQPHLRLARIEGRIEAMKAEWDAPKKIMQKRADEEKLMRALDVLVSSPEPVSAHKRDDGLFHHHFRTLASRGLAQTHETGRIENFTWTATDAGRALAQGA